MRPRPGAETALVEGSRLNGGYSSCTECGRSEKNRDGDPAQGQRIHLRLLGWNDAFVGWSSDLAHLLRVSKSDKCPLLTVGARHLHDAASRSFVDEPLGSSSLINPR